MRDVLYQFGIDCLYRYGIVPLYTPRHPAKGANEEMKMTGRYALRFELTDGTLLEAYHHLSRKADAISAARRAAKDMVSEDIVRVWVDDTKTELEVVGFDTRGWKSKREAMIKEFSR